MTSDNIAIRRSPSYGHTPLGDVSVSKADADAGSPKVGDMIARNPKNSDDMWLVSKRYFEDNFEPL
jgi:hypothetical protein